MRHAAASLVLLLPLAVAAQSVRLRAPIDARRTVVLRGVVSPYALPQYDQGLIEPSQKISGIVLVFTKTAAQQAELERLLEDQQNAASPSYHDWLTPEEYADRFGLNPIDIDRTTAWLTSEGFHVDDVSRSRNWIV